MNLTQKKCVPCEGGIPPLNAEEINTYINQLKSPWRLEESKKIALEFTFKNFKEAMHCVNQVAQIAQSEGHHPDIHIHYNKILIELWTHAIGGLSENDFIVAAKIENILQ